MEKNSTVEPESALKILIPTSVEIVIASLAVLENFMLILVICVRRNLWKRIYYFILSLSLADLITESVTIYINAKVGTS